MTASLFTFENLHRAWVDCRRTKRRRRTSLEFEMNSEMYLLELARELGERTWRPSRPTCFIARNDKYREVFAAAYRDRVVHHLLVSRLEQIWEPVFIHDSYACRKGKGTHAALNRLRRFLRQVTCNGTARAWYLQLDIRSFFPSVDRTRLLEILFSRLEDDELKWLTETIVMDDPTRNPILRSPPGKWKNVPLGKSLFDATGARGLPIGNLTSQFFANVYLNGLDQFVKHELKCRYYIRYVDDFLMLHGDPKVLSEWKSRISEYLKDSLGLILHPERQTQKSVSCGMDFLGYIVHTNHVLIRRRTVNRFAERVLRVESNLCSEEMQRVVISITPQDYEELHSVTSSYLGLFSHADTYRLLESLFRKLWLLELLFRREGNRVFKVLQPPCRRRSLKSLYSYFRSVFSGLLIFQVGCYLEAYDEDALLLASRFGLRLIPPRRGFSKRCGIHSSKKNRLMEGLKDIDTMLIVETGKQAGSSKERQPGQIICSRSSIREKGRIHEFEHPGL